MLIEDFTIDHNYMSLLIKAIRNSKKKNLLTKIDAIEVKKIKFENEELRHTI